MRHQDLTNHVKGSYLKQQYLEAFLVQGAYIESLLRLYADFSFWEVFNEKIQENKYPIVTELRKGLNKENLGELISILSKSKLITQEQKKILDKYRQQRNKVLHDLLAEMGKQTFEKELKEVCELGQEITSAKEFTDMANIVENIEASKSQNNGSQDDTSQNSTALTNQTNNNI